MNRLSALRLVIWLSMAAVGLRLVQLSGRQHAYWKARGDELRVWDEPLPARRGRLLDRRGRALAENQPWVGSSPLTPERQARLAEAQEAGRGQLAGPLRAGRFYPQGALCGHLLGFVSERHAGQGDWVGKEGLEFTLERRLRGRDGRRSWLLNARGNKLRLLGEEAATPGEDVTLTLDLDLQRTARQALSSVLSQLRRNDPQSGLAGAVVVLQAATGRVLSLVSLPDYDPNDFSDPRRSRSLGKLLTHPEAPLLNRAIAGQYPAASTFKIVTASAALAEGLAPPGKRFYCPGVRWIGGQPFGCFVRTGHGELSFEESLAYSCDVVFYDFGLQLGGARLHDWAGRWGLGRVTGIGLPGEAAGHVPDPKQTLAEGGEWSDGANANLAIGQGALLVTPLQMARIVAGVATRGSLWRPRLTEARPGRGPEGPGARVDLPETAWTRLAAGMRQATRSGTAAGAFGQTAGAVQVAGKTGTVENQPSSSNPRGFNHTWFVGYGPLDRPPSEWVAVAVFLERSGGYGGSLAAPVAARVVRRWTQLEENSPFR